MGGEAKKELHYSIEIHSQVNLKNMRKHHMIMKNITLKLLNIILRHILLWTWPRGHLLMDALNYEGVPTDGCSQLYVGDI